MATSRRILTRLLCVSVLAIPVWIATASDANALDFTPLSLQNGWTNSPFGTRPAKVVKRDRIVIFIGAISGGTTGQAFQLSSQFRPSSDVYVKVDLCNAENGQLHIDTSGVAVVQAEGDFSSAQCLTSLEGVSFAVNNSGFTALPLENGWSGSPLSTRDPAAESLDGVVHLEGAMATTGTHPKAFTLPSAFRPSQNVYVPVDLCNGTNGRLRITAANGAVAVQAETDFANAQCFTSLEGVSYVLTPTGSTPLFLTNGWTNGPFSTRNAAIQVIDGVVHLQGAIATTGTDPKAFILWRTFRPTAVVYVPVDLCGAANGRLFIRHHTHAAVQAEDFANAQCFTSLDGVSYAL